MEGKGNNRATRDKERAARMRREGIVRTSGRCAVCYRLITVESWKSRYTHVCH
jgi:predicted HNH restriction endonuclease